MTRFTFGRTTSRVLGVFALAALCGGAALAQEAPQAPGVPGAPGAGGGGRRGQRGGQRQVPAVAAFRAVNPTPEQQTKFDALQSKMREDMMALRGQADARGKMQDINKKFTDDVEALLTPTQQKTFKLEMARAQGNLNGQLESLDLTKEQQKQVRPLVRDAQEELRKLRTDTTVTPETRPAKVETILKDLKAKIRPILTPEQQTKLDALELKVATPRGRGNRNGQGDQGGNGVIGGGQAGNGSQGGGGVPPPPLNPER